MTDQKALEAAFAAWINNPKPDATVKELIAGAIAAYLAALPKPEGEAVALRYRDRANGPDERWTYMTLRSDSSKPGTIQEMVLRRADIYEVEFLGHPASDAREAGLREAVQALERLDERCANRYSSVSDGDRRNDIACERIGVQRATEAVRALLSAPVGEKVETDDGVKL